MQENRIQPITIAALFILLFMAFAVLNDRDGKPVSAAVDRPVPTIPSPTPAAREESDPAAIRAPYDQYTVTQGPHGQSYGQLAIDLTAGKGAEIFSPISGEVTAFYVDELGNTTLIIENTVWQITLMHGNYIVQHGDNVIIGQLVGYESNNGNTVDWQGRSCRGRDCGYHTHLNIYDKRSNSNINPLSIISP